MEKRGIAAIIFDRNGTEYFLILHRIEGWDGWEFMKGEFRNGEVWNEAILREVVRKTGLTRFKAHKKLETAYRYTQPDGTISDYDIYLVETSMNIPVNIRHNDQHDTYLWTTYENAISKITFPEQKKALEEAHSEIKKL